MEDSTIYERGARLANSLDSILEDSPSRAAERVCHDGGRNQLVGVEDQNVLVVVDDARSRRLKLANDVDEGTDSRLSMSPIISQVDGLDQFGPVGFNNQDLSSLVDSPDVKR